MTARSDDVLPEPPAHVPPHLVFDFDYFHDPRLVGDVQAGMMSLHRDAPDVFWTRRNGGHWVLTRLDDFTKVMLRPELFSSDSSPPTAVHAPKLPLPPQDMDAPEHLRHRLLLLKFLSAKEVRKYEPVARQLINDLIDGLEDESSCEFMGAIAVAMPVKLFMTMMGMDLQRYEEFVSWVNDILGASDPTRQMASFVAMTTYLGELIASRIEQPGDDPVSILLASEIDGERITVQRVHEMCNLLFLAGLDTVTNAMTFIMHHLAQTAEMQNALREHPQRLPGAIEEFLRRFSFPNVVRRARDDTDLLNVAMRKDDLVLCAIAAAANDDRVISSPEKLDFERKRQPLVAFNTGPHNCAGASLARIELQVFLAEWLRRMPNVALAPGFVPITRGGPVMAMERLDLIW